MLTQFGAPSRVALFSHWHSIHGFCQKIFIVSLDLSTIYFAHFSGCYIQLLLIVVTLY